MKAELEAEIRSKINPQYENRLGTESYERKVLIEEIDSLRNALNAATNEIDRLRETLESINDLDPSIDSNEGYNEWGEADCFIQAQKLSRTALEYPAT